ncbi:MAG: hypothetical protein RLZ37_842 [Actinomycetota bacterium]
MTRNVGDITAVITCHDSGPLLVRALESVASQGSINIVLVDDGSTHCSCFELAPRYEQLVHVVKDNGGHPTALNYGLDHVRTDVVAFLDDDDEWLPGKTERQLELLNSTKADVVIGGVWNVRDCAGAGEERAYFPSARMLGSSMFTMSGLHRVGPFSQETRHHSIVDWWSRADEICLEAVHDDEPALLRRIHGQNSGIVHRDVARHDLLHHLRNHVTRRKSP